MLFFGMAPQPELPPPLSPKQALMGRSWGFAATLGFGAVVIVGFFLTAVVPFAFFLGWKGINPNLPHDELVKLAMNGKLIVIVGVLAFCLFVGLPLLFAKFRRGLPIRDYFALKWPRKAIVSGPRIWVPVTLFAGALVLGLFDPENRQLPDLWATAGTWKVFLIVALVVIDPFSQEFFFRGFLFTGVKCSRAGDVGAIVVTALLFAIVCGVTDLRQGAFGFVLGGLLGVVRLKTDSLWVCMAVHGCVHLTSLLIFLATAGRGG